jgi:hypothetical protein
MWEIMPAKLGHDSKNAYQKHANSHTSLIGNHVPTSKGV